MLAPVVSCSRFTAAASSWKAASASAGVESRVISVPEQLLAAGLTCLRQSPSCCSRWRTASRPARASRRGAPCAAPPTAAAPSGPAPQRRRRQREAAAQRGLRRCDNAMCGVAAYLGAFNVLQELVAEPPVLGRAVHQAGNVGHRETAPILRCGSCQRLPVQRGPARAPYFKLDHADGGVERGERVGGDLGPRSGEGAQQRALARIGVPHQADVRQQLQLKLQVPLLPRHAAHVVDVALRGHMCVVCVCEWAE